MSEHPSDYAITLGERLRAIRNGQHLTLRDVHVNSAGEWPASVTGSYERGSRVISPERLIALCGFYGVDPREVLTGEPVPVTEPEHLAVAYEAVIATLRSEVAMLRAQTREAVA